MRGPRLAAMVTLVLAGSVALAVPAAAAPLCALDTTAKRLTVTSQGESGVRIEAGSGYLLVNDAACATLTQVDTVAVDMAATASQLRLDVFDPLGPGATDEGNGSSEIEFELSGFGSDTRMAVTGGSQVHAGSYLSQQTGLFLGHINLNPAADGATRDVDVVINGALPRILELTASPYAPNAVMSGAGAGGFGARPYFGTLALSADSWSSQLTGGSGDDVLYTGPSGSSSEPPETYSGGGGSDSLVIEEPNFSTDLYAEFSLDDIANDGLHCPGPGCESDNVRSDIEELYGSAMDEHFLGSPLNTFINGGGGDDVIEGGGGRDTMYGGLGRDLLAGGAGKDVLWGGYAGGGGDDLWGGQGDDTVRYNVTGPVEVSLNGLADDGPIGERDNIASDVETVVGTFEADVFIGNAQANTFSGRGGDDQFTGRGGDDTLLGGLDNDSFSGGPGIDRCAQGPGSGPKVDCET